MSVHIVIPARFGSMRLPGKPLADVAGKAMIVRVLERASQAACDSCVAAVDNTDVKDVVEQAGFAAVMTNEAHLSGSDRVMEVAALMGWDEQDIVVNVQGDEPLIPPVVIDDVIQAITENTVGIATVCEPIEDNKIFADPNAVKVVIANSGCALYFSRAGIPYPRESGDVQNAYRHIGIYAFRVAALRRITSLALGTLESIEKLEQLRWLEAGENIQVIKARQSVPGGVDTAEDLAAVVRHFSEQTSLSD